jgi:hypothetical protein
VASSEMPWRMKILRKSWSVVANVVSLALVRQKTSRYGTYAQPFLLYITAKKFE